MPHAAPVATTIGNHRAVAIDKHELSDWALALNRVDRLLEVARDHLLEDLVNPRENEWVVDVVEAMMVATAGLVRELKQTIENAEDAPQP